VRFIVAGDIKSPQKRSLRLKWYRAERTGEEAETLRERAITLPDTCIAYFVHKHVLPIKTQSARSSEMMVTM
jgi:hypothetical protein